MNNRKLLVSDYDNTIEFHYKDTDNEKILKNNMSSIDEFMKQNIFCIATGRHFNAIFETLQNNKMNFNYLCANNGAELYDENYSLLFFLPIDKEDLKKLKELNMSYEVFFRNPCKSNQITSVNIYIEDLTKYKEVKKFLDINLKKSFVEYKFPKIKIINDKCNKVNIIEMIQKNEHILDNNIYTIGDDVNDIEMIKKYNGYSLSKSNKKAQIYAKRIYNELNEFINDILKEVV